MKLTVLDRPLVIKTAANELMDAIRQPDLRLGVGTYELTGHNFAENEFSVLGPPNNKRFQSKPGKVYLQFKVEYKEGTNTPHNVHVNIYLGSTIDKTMLANILPNITVFKEANITIEVRSFYSIESFEDDHLY